VSFNCQYIGECGKWRRNGVAARTMLPASNRVEHAPGSAVELDRVHFGARQACVDVHDPGVDGGRGKGQRHLRGAVFADHHQPVAGAHVQFLQCLRRRIDGA
jgi:hypothetical protein